MASQSAGEIDGSWLDGTFFDIGDSPFLLFLNGFSGTFKPFSYRCLFHGEPLGDFPKRLFLFAPQE